VVLVQRPRYVLAKHEMGVRFPRTTSPCRIKLSVKLFEAGDLDHEPCGKGSALLRRKGLKALLGSIPR
jgi:hypothetical protein